MIRLTEWESVELMREFPSAQIVATKHHHFAVCSDTSDIASFIRALRDRYIVSRHYDPVTLKERREAKNAYFKQLAAARRERERMA